MTDPAVDARGVVEALVREIESMVASGRISTKDAFPLLHRAIDHLPPQDRRLLRLEVQAAWARREQASRPS
ncbi:hypothetical protein [Teichococcus deserti]|uniref:hypothetical protein n=1 Tax=Teichococcus deserti TaxID=1817963 RepID=UPI001055226C|nr:hypothetical protein [Pseudoroseomonas deserti]